jgi:hypothetical protein
MYPGSTVFEGVLRLDRLEIRLHIDVFERIESVNERFFVIFLLHCQIIVKFFHTVCRPGTNYFMENITSNTQHNENLCRKSRDGDEYRFAYNIVHTQ